MATSPAERTERPSRVAVIGLGRMGCPMADRLAAAGFSVVGFDTDPAARAGAPNGVGVLGSLRDAVRDTDAVILMLPSSDAVEACVDAGLLDVMRPGATLIDMGSSDPPRTVELAKRAEQKSIAVLDAPVSGGVRGAQEGRLAIMVGGPAEVADRHRGLFEALGENVWHVGAVGCGHALKALNNAISAVTFLASNEALLVGRRFGLQPSVMLEVINGSTGASYSTRVKIPQHVLNQRYDSGFTLALLTKDLDTCLRLADRVGVPMRIGGANRAAWEDAAADLPAGVDHTMAAAWLEHLAEQTVDADD